MIQCGLVIKNLNTTAKVRMQRHAGCAGCTACKMGSSGKPIELEASNPKQAREGQMVEVEMENQHVLLASFLMYIVPLMFLIVGVIVGHYGLQILGVTTYSDVLTAVIAFAFTGLAYVVLNRSEKTKGYKEKMLPVIISILPDPEEPTLQ